MKYCNPIIKALTIRESNVAIENPRTKWRFRVSFAGKIIEIFQPRLISGGFVPGGFVRKSGTPQPNGLSSFSLFNSYFRGYTPIFRHTQVSIRPHYEHETWSGTRLQLRRWQRGETGFPLVDAAMRQLWKVEWGRCEPHPPFQ